MPTFYIDGQSLGNETISSPRRARLTIGFRPDASLGCNTPLRVITEDIGDRTNNEAEYHALLRLLSLLETHNRTIKDQITIYSDSQLLVKQMSGEYQVREERLRRLRDEARELIQKIGSIRIDWVPREENLAGLWFERRIQGKQVRPEEFLSGY